MRHVKLPDEAEVQEVQEQAVQAAGHRAAAHIHGWVYIANIKCSGFSALTCISILTHDEDYSTEQFQEMVNEGVKFINEVRIKHRREEMSRQRVAIHDADKSNELMFEQDIEAFDAFMVDRYRFKRVMAAEAAGTIEATVKV